MNLLHQMNLSVWSSVSFVYFEIQELLHPPVCLDSCDDPAWTSLLKKGIKTYDPRNIVISRRL